jgi:hypothetical protein
MSTLTIQLDDDAARLVQQAAQLVAQPLEIWSQEKLCPAATGVLTNVKPAGRRVSPLHPDVMRPAPDFNAPLEEFAPYV